MLYISYRVIGEYIRNGEMAFKSSIGVAIACLVAVTFNTNAAIMNADWKTTSDNLITQDTGSGLEWFVLCP